jgi:hypothetical protein
MFWPREIWGRYAPQLADFKEPEDAVAAVAALNDMVRERAREDGGGCTVGWCKGGWCLGLPPFSSLMRRSPSDGQ